MDCFFYLKKDHGCIFTCFFFFPCFPRGNRSLSPALRSFSRIKFSVQETVYGGNFPGEILYWGNFPEFIYGILFICLTFSIRCSILHEEKIFWGISREKFNGEGIVVGIYPYGVGIFRGKFLSWGILCEINFPLARDFRGKFSRGVSRGLPIWTGKVTEIR